MDSETNTSVIPETDNANPTPREPAPDPDFDNSPIENTGEEQAEGALESETDEATGEEPAQEAETDDDQGDETDGEATGEEPPKTAVITMPDGKKLSLDELTKGYERQADYTRKTQTLQTEYKERTSRNEALSTRLESILAVTTQFFEKQIPPAPDMAMSMTDPTRYIQMKAAHEQAMTQVQQLVSLAEQPKQVKSALNEAQTAERLQEETRQLHAFLPQLAKPESKAKFFDKALNVGKSIGFSDAEIQGMSDHRFFRLADLAIEGLAAREARKVAQKKVANVPAVAPQRRTVLGANPNKDIMSKAKKSGGMSMNDAFKLVGDFN